MIVDVKNGDMYFDIFLDGQKLQHCIRADSELGTAVCHVTSKDGNLVLINGNIIEVTHHGKIEIFKQLKRSTL